MLYIRELSPSLNVQSDSPSKQIMLSIYLNSSTCIYLSLDNGVAMTSKRRENKNQNIKSLLKALVVSS